MYMQRLNKTESPIFVKLLCSLFPMATFLIFIFLGEWKKPSWETILSRLFCLISEPILSF